jgi:hypothetical protein
VPSPHLRQKGTYISVARRSTSTTNPPLFSPSAERRNHIVCVSETNHELNRISRITRNSCPILGFTARKRIDFGNIRKGVLVLKRSCFVLQLNFSQLFFRCLRAVLLFLIWSYHRHIVTLSQPHFWGKGREILRVSPYKTIPSHTHNPHI